MRKSNKNQRKNIITKDYVALSSIEYESEERALNEYDKITDTSAYDLGHIYGS
jgi:hypothetical protein